MVADKEHRNELQDHGLQALEPQRDSSDPKMFEYSMPKRNTVQRQAILEELRHTAQHPTAGELYRLVRKRLPRISLGTVYRNLEVLVQAKLIRKLEGSGREARFDPILEEHYHVRCLGCGRIDDLENPPEISLNTSARRQEGWEITDHRVEFVGNCPDCLNAPESIGKKSINNRQVRPSGTDPAGTRRLQS